ncbi:MAG: hypothetical protein A2687_02110 [Candidatus Levybacteria bacterium RIFCSPHIGHO2_01_FULL_38_26]|nr:MAG: hypothetical protein A2687_02110 [Candidatus Levybacteria bacterium RIFCSPHIGHO2_01_FULL_38_26]
MEGKQEIQPMQPISEKPAALDRRAEVPDFIPFLKPGERVINVETPIIKTPNEYPSSLKALKILAGVDVGGSFREIGLHGPSVASRAVKENEGIEALRKFEVLFGRDSLRVALDVSDHYPELLKTTILNLAQLQGVRENIKSEEQVGRIIHEYRDPATDSIAQRITQEHGWEWPYYASVDATVSYVNAISEYCKKSSEGINFLNQQFLGKDGQEHTIGDSLKTATSWIKHRMDYRMIENENGENVEVKNEEGLIESKALFKGSHQNQVWKDSWDSYHHKDGTMANHKQGIASIEVQAQAFDAMLGASETYEKLMEALPGGQRQVYKDEVMDFKKRAENLKKMVMEKFWVEDEKGGYFVLGTDRDDNGILRQLKIRTSNMGHLLNSRILDGDDPEILDKRNKVIKTLFSKEMLAASGIRTLASDEVRFWPGRYHNGNVWLWDTYYISQGLERHGFYGLSAELNRRIWSVVDKFHKFPEFARGGDEPEPMLNTRIVDLWDETNNRRNRIEQPPQEIQAWTVAAMVDAKYKRGNQVLGRQERLPTVAIDQDKRQLEEEVFPSRT